MALAVSSVPELPERGALAAYAGAVGRAAAAELPDHVSVVWKGSAHKSWDGPYDFLPGLSDIDVHVYRPGGLDDPWTLRRRIRDEVGPAPYGTPLQLLVIDPDTMPEWWTLLPGTYEILAGGTPPVPVPPRHLLLDRDRFGLAEAHGHADSVTSGVLACGDADLWPYLLTVRWMFIPMLYRGVSLEGGEPEKAWAMNRTELLAAADEHPPLAPLRAATIDYLEAALAACSSRPAPAAAADALRVGEHLLRVAGDWAAARPDAAVDRRRTLS